MSTATPRRRPRRVVTRRAVSGATVAGVVLLGALIGIAWRATDALWFLLFPLLVVGVLAAAAMAILWGLRHF